MNNEIAKAENKKTHCKNKDVNQWQQMIEQALQRKVPGDSETSIMPSGSEADVSNDVLQYVSPGDKKTLKRLNLTWPSESAQKTLRMVGISTSTLGRKPSYACAIKEILYQDKNIVVVPDEKKSKKMCDTVCLPSKVSMKSI